ncbi:MAG: hypothetical protein Q7S92_05135 [Candidatus Diapherotrites archaeon]|nr:hypothetical protein [Candidatus Diapherotrites archaeon]
MEKPPIRKKPLAITMPVRLKIRLVRMKSIAGKRRLLERLKTKEGINLGLVREARTQLEKLKGISELRRPEKPLPAFFRNPELAKTEILKNQAPLTLPELAQAGVSAKQLRTIKIPMDFIVEKLKEHDWPNDRIADYLEESGYSMLASNLRKRR